MKPRLIDTLILLVLAAVSLGACAGLPFTGGSSWKEEVLLHDGRTLIVARWIIRGPGGRHEIGQPPSITEGGLRFVLPGTGERVQWKSVLDKDIGFIDLKPLLLDVISGTAYLVTEPLGCLSYNKWGRPNPPYVIFKYQDQTWKQIPIQELPPQAKAPNLIISSTDVEIKKLGTRHVTAQMIQKANSEWNQKQDPIYRTILREPTTGGNIGCTVMVRYRGHWIWDKDPIARKSIDIEIINKNRKNTPDQGKPDRQAPEKATP